MVPLDEIALPVAGDDALVDLIGPVIDEGHGIEEGALVAFGRACSALGTVAAQQLENLGAQLSTRHGVEGGVEGLVRDADRRGHTCQCGRDLGGTQVAAHLAEDELPQRCAGNQLAFDSGLLVQAVCAQIGGPGQIHAVPPAAALGGGLRRPLPTVTRHLAGDGRTCALESGGDRRRTQAQR